jgi:hypothetical protein
LRAAWAKIQAGSQGRRDSEAPYSEGLQGCCCQDPWRFPHDGSLVGKKARRIVIVP